MSSQQSQSEIEKKMMEELSDLMGKHMSGLTAGALKKRLELVDILEKENENLKTDVNNKSEHIKKQDQKIVELNAQIQQLEANRNKETELKNKEEELSRKEWELNKEKDFSTKQIELIQESKKEMFDLTKVLFGSQTKTEVISRLFNQTPVFGPNGQPATIQNSETTTTQSN